MRNLIQSKKRLVFVLLAILVAISITYLLTRSSNFVPTVRSSIPADGQFLNINGAIQIEFAQELSASEQKKVIVVADPNFTHRIVWDAANLMSIIPEDLQPTDHLTISIFYRKKSIYNLNLIAVTSNYDTSELNQQAQKQAADDLVFSQKITEYYATYPFLNQLPISNSDYVMVFEPDTSKIRVRILGENETLIRQQAINKAKEIGVDTIKIPILFIK